MTTKVRGLLVDYGGVLTNDLYQVLEDFCSSQGIPVTSFTDLMTGNGPRQRMFQAYERGEVTSDDFLPNVAEWLGVPRTAVDSMFEHLVPDPIMFEVLEAIRDQGVPLALLSNSWGTYMYPMNRLEEVFDDLLISGLVGMRKPDPDIYQFAARRIGLAPDQCLFIDDTLVNVEGARAVGMEAIHHTDRATSIKRFEDTLGVDLQKFQALVQ